MIDPILQHLHQEDVAEAKMPKCECCGNAIWDDELVDIDCKIWCMKCARDLLVRYTDDYVLEEEGD